MQLIRSYHNIPSFSFASPTTTLTNQRGLIIDSPEPMNAEHFAIDSEPWKQVVDDVFVPSPQATLQIVLRDHKSRCAA